MDRPHYSRQDIAELLRSQDITPTHQRIEIAHALYSRQEHMSADRVLAIVNERNPQTSRATVYNNLKLFTQKRLVREVIVDPDRVFYDPNTCPHYHLYNIETGRLTDIHAADVRIERLPEPPPGMVTEGMDIIIRVRSASAKDT
jgi:Fur family iron response transcriptional regulator